MLVRNQLVTEFIPFLPLSQEIVMKCIGDVMIQMNKGNRYLDRKHEVLMHMDWIPDQQNPIFSRSGCSKVKERVQFLMLGSDEL